MRDARIDPRVMEKFGNDYVAVDVQAQQALAMATEAALVRSFEERPMLGDTTERELKRRMRLCEDMIKVCRFELRMSVYRIANLLHGLLLKRLDGVDWEPEGRRSMFALDRGNLQGGRPARGTLLGPDGRVLTTAN